MINKGQLGYYSGSDAKPKSNASLVGSIEYIVENELSFFHMKKTRSGTKFIDSTYDTFHFYPKGCICSQEKTKTIDNPLVSKIGTKKKMHAMMDVNEWMDTNFVMSYQSLCFHQKHPKNIIPFTHLGYAKEDTTLFELDSNEKLKESDIIYKKKISMFPESERYIGVLYANYHYCVVEFLIQSKIIIITDGLCFFWLNVVKRIIEKDMPSVNNNNIIIGYHSKKKEDLLPRLLQLNIIEW